MDLLAKSLMFQRRKMKIKNTNLSFSKTERIGIIITKLRLQVAISIQYTILYRERNYCVTGINRAGYLLVQMIILIGTWSSTHVLHCHLIDVHGW